MTRDVKSQVVMLPADNKSRIILDRNQNKLKLVKELSATKEDWNKSLLLQHLYITTDDKIEEGEYCIHLSTKEVIKYPKGGFPKGHSKKIIATTDTSLARLADCPVRGSNSSIKYVLPQPSQQFIEQYVESYNKGEVIDSIMVEYLQYTTQYVIKESNIHSKYDEKSTNIFYRLLINQDNTINIKLIKDSWNREEIDFELNRLIGKAIRDKNLIFNPHSNNVVNWIKENYYDRT